MRKLAGLAALSLLCAGACGPGRVPPVEGVPQLQPTRAVMPPSRVSASPAVPIETGSAAAGPSSPVLEFPDPQAYTWRPVVAGLNSPVDIQFSDDPTGSMFVVEQVGRIRVVENGRLLDPPFLDITDRVGSAGNEQGLLGLAFHPNSAHNPFIYVNYTDRDGNTVIARFQFSGNEADPSTEKDLVHIAQPFPNHNGGETIFGPDGYLYLGLGDGGSQGDPFGNAQNGNVLLGKILRIDVDGGNPYRIPSDNPFAGANPVARKKPEVWAYGLRNPWRFSFDKLTGDLYIADVGQDTWEEVDFLPARSLGGTNFGWNYREGAHPFKGNAPSALQLTDPVAEYNHAEGGCAITGGYVYRGRLPEWQGIYLYGDYCSGKIWGLLPAPNPGRGTGWRSELLFKTGANITSFGQDPAGEIYFADRSGILFRLQK
jgi:glucose/arabinose dehydrogenase